MIKILKCSSCGKEFERLLKNCNQNSKKSRKIYCSISCKNKGQVTSISVKCGTCGKTVKNVFPLRVKRSKSGLIFCSKSCSATFTNKGGRKHFKGGASVYRTQALKYYGVKCSVCGYKIKRVLEVHHKDGNRKNNKIENLDVLCPTHHTEYQVGVRKY